jgi:hypothetical protein
MIKTALGVPMMSKTWSKAWEGLFTSRPTIYIYFILIATLVSYALWLRTDAIFSCQADGYNSDRYLAYCNGANYADYEHGAFYFDLEPSAQNFARKADVLFLGNSRLQVAFSTVATADWFSAASARYYLMGFAYFENVIFAEKLLRRLRPRARVYVINVDDFFERSETIPVKTILHDPDARNRYERKRFWQRVHWPICKIFAGLCGADTAIFRSRENGAYTERPAKRALNITPVTFDQVINQDVVNSNTAAAIDFLSHLPVERKCVILTMVPTVGTEIGKANAIAEGLAMKLVTPGSLEGLQTFDGSHLDQPSAERWSQAFFQAARSRIRSCLGEQGAATPVGSSL